MQCSVCKGVPQLMQLVRTVARGVGTGTILSVRISFAFSFDPRTANAGVFRLVIAHPIAFFEIWTRRAGTEWMRAEPPGKLITRISNAAPNLSIWRTATFPAFTLKPADRIAVEFGGFFFSKMFNGSGSIAVYHDFVPFLSWT